MVDPRERDPRFPNRPTHEDFILLSEVVQENDRRAETTSDDPITMSGIDSQSLIYLMENRFEMFQSRVGSLAKASSTMQALMKAIWLDGLILGKKFAERREEGRSDD